MSVDTVKLLTPDSGHLSHDSRHCWHSVRASPAGCFIKFVPSHVLQDVLTHSIIAALLRDLTEAQGEASHWRVPAASSAGPRQEKVSCAWMQQLMDEVLY